MGDPAGVGPELIVRSAKSLPKGVEYVFLGQQWLLDKINAVRFKPRDASIIDIPVIPPKNFRYGKMSALSGRASIAYLDEAVRLIKDKRIDALVTCPVSKEAVNLAGLKGFSGHTEYLAGYFGVDKYVMMLMNDRIKMSLVTRHIALKKVAQAINKENVRTTICYTYRALKRFFAMNNPRLVVAGLNPHASDNGIIGDEEVKVVVPVVKSMRRSGMSISGPLSADVAIAKAYSGKFDAVVAMYHDQALIALKLFGSNSGVNMTLGLPFVRTSPLHGTAFDIAGKGKVNCASFLEAVKLAVKCAVFQKKD